MEPVRRERVFLITYEVSKMQGLNMTFTESVQTWMELYGLDEFPMMLADQAYEDYRYICELYGKDWDQWIAEMKAIKGE
jgi:hypothetical protein